MEILHGNRASAGSGFAWCKTDRTVTSTIPPRRDQRRAKSAVIPISRFYTVQGKYRSVSWSKRATVIRCGFFNVSSAAAESAQVSLQFLKLQRNDHGFFFVFLFSFSQQEIGRITSWTHTCTYLVAILVFLASWKRDPKYHITPRLI